MGMLRGVIEETQKFYLMIQREWVDEGDPAARIGIGKRGQRR